MLTGELSYLGDRFVLSTVISLFFLPLSERCINIDKNTVSKSH